MFSLMICNGDKPDASMLEQLLSLCPGSKQRQQHRLSYCSKQGCLLHCMHCACVESTSCHSAACNLVRICVVNVVVLLSPPWIAQIIMLLTFNSVYRQRRQRCCSSRRAMCLVQHDHFVRFCCRCRTARLPESSCFSRTI